MSFYRNFFDQIGGPAEAVFYYDGLHLNTRDSQSEMFSIIERDDIEFNEFEGSGRYAE